MTIPVKSLKYLGRVFAVELSQLERDFSEELEQCIGSSSGYLLLAQVVDSASRETIDDYGLQFYALGCEDDVLKTSGPVRFKNLLTKEQEHELVELRLSDTNQARKEELEQRYDLLRDLKTYDADL